MTIHIHAFHPTNKQTTTPDNKSPSPQYKQTALRVATAGAALGAAAIAIYTFTPESTINTAYSSFSRATPSATPSVTLKEPMNFFYQLFCQYFPECLTSRFCEQI